MVVDSPMTIGYCPIYLKQMLNVATNPVVLNFAGPEEIPIAPDSGSDSFWLRPTPEPTTLALLMTGGLIMLRRRSQATGLTH